MASLPAFFELISIIHSTLFYGLSINSASLQSPSGPGHSTSWAPEICSSRPSTATETSNGSRSSAFAGTTSSQGGNQPKDFRGRDKFKEVLIQLQFLGPVSSIFPLVSTQSYMSPELGAPDPFPLLAIEQLKSGIASSFSLNILVWRQSCNVVKYIMYAFIANLGRIGYEEIHCDAFRR